VPKYDAENRAAPPTAPSPGVARPLRGAEAALPSDAAEFIGDEPVPEETKSAAPDCRVGPRLLRDRRGSRGRHTDVGRKRRGAEEGRIDHGPKSDGRGAHPTYGNIRQSRGDPELRRSFSGSDHLHAHRAGRAGNPVAVLCRTDPNPAIPAGHTSQPFVELFAAPARDRDQRLPSPAKPFAANALEWPRWVDDSPAASNG